MTLPFISRLCQAVAASDGRDAACRTLIGRAIADTVGVAAAGSLEPCARHAVAAYGGRSGQGTRTWSGAWVESEDAAALADAIAAHALDFDDVFLDSATHPSTVILPAILRLDRDDAPGELIAAFAAGLIAALSIAERLGPGHYHRGWHGTGTIGAFAATAAACRLLRLDERRIAHAFALAAAQSGGLRVNFGTMAKPAQAGFAASVGVRAARLAAAGVTGSPDVFAVGGYADLYGVDGVAQSSAESLAPHPERIALKLYPCCYASHRLIGITRDARAGIGARLSGDVRIEVTAPAGSLDVLRYDVPTNGMEAKFSGRYCIAAALLDDVPTLAHFGETPLPTVVGGMTRVSLAEDPSQQSGGDIEAGCVRLVVRAADGDVVGAFAREAIPGSPRDPAAPEAVAAKLAACAASFEREAGTAFPILAHAARIREAAEWLPTGPQLRAAE
ncbi:MAG: MmgE/PrpD family protein [Acetobacteraceae bacterium]|nr:MmgE/PrpD family protein [Acetobacteraceae bacterium]